MASPVPSSAHRLYNFPPLFTLQVNTDTRNKQIATWHEIILQYCVENKVNAINVTENNIFSNAAIDRKLSQDAVVTVLDSLVELGKVKV